MSAQANGNHPGACDGWQQLRRLLRELLIWIYQIGPRQPGRPVLFLQEQIMPDKFRHTFALPPAVSPTDVARRDLAVELEGQIHQTFEIVPSDAALSPPVVLELGAVVRAWLIDSDAAGNQSAGDPLTFTVTDTVPPAKPGVLSVANVEQVFDEPPAA